ncbi:MAG: hypothetical protein ACRCUY_02805 [Thermoguttaceae bacterium]
MTNSVSPPFDVEISDNHQLQSENLPQKEEKFSYISREIEFTESRSFDVSDRLSGHFETIEGKYVESDIAEEDSLCLNSPQVDSISTPFVGNWNAVVSQTNWEKGAIICRWRSELIGKNMSRGAYSDEAWSRRVGNVTAQHVGRLRRVAERFGEKKNEYPNLFWSHFQVALDWEDAELWLEGATQSSWSVAQMRIQRWEAIGAPEDLKPKPEDIIEGEIESGGHAEITFGSDSQNHSPSKNKELGKETKTRTADIGSADLVEGFDPNSAPFDIDQENITPRKRSDSKQFTEATDLPSTGQLLESLRACSELPSDLAEALEALKVAILSHKLAGWKDVPRQKVAQCVEWMQGLINSVEDK